MKLPRALAGGKYLGVRCVLMPKKLRQHLGSAYFGELEGVPSWD